MIIVEDVWDMVTKDNNKELLLEIIRLKSICRAAAKELETLSYILEENNIFKKNATTLIQACKNEIYVNYIHEFLDLQYELEEVIEEK